MVLAIIALFIQSITFIFVGLVSFANFCCGRHSQDKGIFSKYLKLRFMLILLHILAVILLIVLGFFSYRCVTDDVDRCYIEGLLLLGVIFCLSFLSMLIVAMFCWLHFKCRISNSIDKIVCLELGFLLVTGIACAGLSTYAFVKQVVESTS